MDRQRIHEISERIGVLKAQIGALETEIRTLEIERERQWTPGAGKSNGASANATPTPSDTACPAADQSIRGTGITSGPKVLEYMSTRRGVALTARQIAEGIGRSEDKVVQAIRSSLKRLAKAKPPKVTRTKAGAYMLPKEASA